MVATIDQPDYKLEVFMATSAVWAEVTNLVEFSFTRGREEELQAIEPGRLTAVADNNAGTWSPFNAAGTYYGNPWVGAAVRLTCTYNAVSYPLFAGFVEGWQAAPASQMDANVIITAVDELKFLATSDQAMGPFTQETVDDRISNVILGGFYRNEFGAGTIDSTDEEVLPVTLALGDLGMAHILACLEGERGIFFIAADGGWTYHSRRHRYDNASGNTSQATFGQPDPVTGLYAGGVLPFVEGPTILDDQRVYNRIAVDASGAGETAINSDATSRLQHGVKKLAVSAPFLTAGYAQTLCDYLLYVYKNPFVHIEQLVVEPGDAATWAQALGREIGDRITVIIDRPGTIGLSRDFWIEGITMEYRPETGHRTTWQLFDALVGGVGNPFRIGISELDGPDIITF